MKTLKLFIGLLLFTSPLFAKAPEDRVKEKDVIGVKTEVYYEKAKEAGVVEDVDGVVKIKPADWKSVKISTRIDLRILDEIGDEAQQAAKILSGVDTDTTLREKVAVIVDEEVMVTTQAFAASIAPIRIDTYDVGYQVRELNKTFLSVQESEKLKEVLRMIPSRQYPIVKFPFIETTNDDPELYWVDVSRWVNIAKMKEEIKNKKIKLAVFGVGKSMESSSNNFDMIQHEGLSTNDFVLSGKEFEIAENAFKSIRPDVPIARICVLHPTLQAWLDSFATQPDAWILFNVGTFGASWSKIKSRWFIGKPVITTLNYGAGINQGYGSDKYKTTISTLKALGYSGNIFWRVK